MFYNRELNHFLTNVRGDGRIGPSHISIFIAILQYASENEKQNPIRAFSRDLMPLAKISTTATFNKNIHELDHYGYIRYIPSYNHFIGSLIYFDLEFTNM